jgi:RNA polymerase sigma-70 factor (ECF subfamily)
MIEKEWEIYICERAMKNIQKIFSERALNVFKMFIEGVEVSEIAEKMDIKENSVYKLKNRVKAKYQQEIKDLCHHLEPGHELS